MSGYLIDTNVVSETRKSRPDTHVVAFLASAEPSALFLSVLTLGELRKGIDLKRRVDAAFADRLGAWADSIEKTFASRVLPIDADIARRWGEWSAARAVPVIDALIAATALRHGLTLVTRNVRDVERIGVPVLDPWQAQ